MFQDPSGASSLHSEDSEDAGKPASGRPPKKAFDEPSEHDFDLIKLVSNGAYGAVYLVKHRETRQR